MDKPRFKIGDKVLCTDAGNYFDYQWMGGDDFGLELDFPPDKEQEARFTYDIIDIQITIQELLDLGFKYA